MDSRCNPEIARTRSSDMRDRSQTEILIFITLVGTIYENTVSGTPVLGEILYNQPVRCDVILGTEMNIKISVLFAVLLFLGFYDNKGLFRFEFPGILLKIVITFLMTVF